MKKIILFLVISVMCVSVYAQTVVEVESNRPWEPKIVRCKGEWVYRPLLHYA